MLTNFIQLFEEIDTHFPRLMNKNEESEEKQEKKFIRMSLTKKKMERS